MVDYPIFFLSLSTWHNGSASKSAVFLYLLQPEYDDRIWLLGIWGWDFGLGFGLRLVIFTLGHIQFEFREKYLSIKVLKGSKLHIIKAE